MADPQPEIIIVVDDDDGVTGAICDALNVSGLVAIAADGLDSALLAWSRYPGAAFLIDQDLGLDRGEDLIRQLRTLSGDRPLRIGSMSGYPPDPGFSIERAEVFFSKPLDLALVVCWFRSSNPGVHSS